MHKTVFYKVTIYNELFGDFSEHITNDLEFTLGCFRDYRIGSIVMIKHF